MAKKAARKNLRTVLEKLAGMAEENAQDAKIIAEKVNGMLDDLLSDNFFGTEGQLDPRGDPRNG